MGRRSKGSRNRAKERGTLHIPKRNGDLVVIHKAVYFDTKRGLRRADKSK